MKRIIFLFSTITIILSACGTPQLAPTATLAATNTPAPTATQTQIPIPTNTPTPTITPIPKVPEEVSEFFKKIDWSDFIPVTHEQRIALAHEFINDQSQWKLPSDPNSVIKPIRLNTNVSPDGTSVVLGCEFNENCVPHYVVVENIPEGLLYIVIWELITKEADGKNARVSFSTAFTSDSISKDWQLGMIREIGTYGNGAQIHLNLVINLKVSNLSTTDLARTLLVDDPARLAVTKGIINEQTTDTLFWTTAISSCPCY